MSGFFLKIFFAFPDRRFPTDLIIAASNRYFKQITEPYLFGSDLDSFSILGILEWMKNKQFNQGFSDKFSQEKRNILHCFVLNSDGHCKADY